MSAAAQDASQLPAAPSAVLAQYAVGPPAGSGRVYQPASTTDGPDGIRVEHATAEPMPISIDDAVAFGLDRNYRIVYDRAKQKAVKGDVYQVFNALIPTLRLDASTATEELNLAAMGFKPGAIKIPGFNANIPTIVKVDVTQAALHVNQTLFSAPAWELLKAAKDEKDVVDLNVLSGHADLVQAVVTAYLKVLSDQASLANAQALEASGKTLFDQATEKRKAGVGTSLDELRGRVEYQNRQQQRIAAENALAKDFIQLNRIMGLPAEQQLVLTDTAPFTDLADMTLERARDTAYGRRKDYLSLLSQERVAHREQLAVKYQRLPTLAFGGFYGVLGETEGLYHGVFTAQGSLKFPIFREAAQRGEQKVIDAQMMAIKQREADARTNIDGQIRTALLDVASSHELVKVAQSNVELAQQQLSDVTDRFKAGVDDNLPVVDAQAALAGAQAQLVQSLYQYNTAKLNLARATGIIETQYRTYLGTR